MSSRSRTGAGASSSRSRGARDNDDIGGSSRNDRDYDNGSRNDRYDDDESPRYKSSSRRNEDDLGYGGVSSTKKIFGGRNNTSRNGSRDDDGGDNNEDNEYSYSAAPRKGAGSHGNGGFSSNSRSENYDSPRRARGGGQDMEMSNTGRNGGEEKWENEEYDSKSYGSDLEYGDDDDGVVKKPSMLEKFCCCCCPKSKKGRIICGAVVFVVLAVLGVVLYLYIPRFPQIKVNSINLSSLASGSAFTFTTPNNNGNLNEMTIGMGLSMSVATFNPNLYGLQVDKIDLIAYMMVNTTYVNNPLLVTPLTGLSSLLSLVTASGSPPNASSIPSGYTPSTSPQIGTAEQGSIYFPSNAWVNYTMIFNLNFTPDPYVGLLKDPAVEEIADACGITSRYKPAGRPMKIHYDATSTVSVLKPLGYAPSISNDISISCPVTSDQIDSVVAAVESGSDPVSALQSVLSGSG
ncbi:hypothetical protein HK100_009852 [Physocladia obscura]|uniref:Late embryogenesis abundant protein LEA-2 subgroup domain-containing protein n=1 Tax=Physocladia obscura TaxID=109957 RepID=A0AAD5T4P4_9FUNG|nr:hypothetical protein HK100_009852 [Physocladia obscura]